MPAWQPLQENQDTRKAFREIVSERLKVHGGWIIRTVVTNHGNDSIALDQIFVSDPSHAWQD